MPHHDPVPPRPTPPRPQPSQPSPPREDGASLRGRMRQLALWIGVAAVVAVLLALIWLKSFGDPVPLHMQLATILGVGFSVLVGGGLMALVFLSNRSGHDEGASYGGDHDERG